MRSTQFQRALCGLPVVDRGLKRAGPPSEVSGRCTRLGLLQHGDDALFANLRPVHLVGLSVSAGYQSNLEKN